MRSALTLALCLMLQLLPASQPPAERVSTLDLPPKAELAINRGLAYVARVQNKDGSWGNKYQVTHTAMALLAFMVQGHVPGEGTYGRSMDRGIDYLVSRSRAHNGYFADPSSATMYQHCYATMALAEAWGQAKRPELRPVVKQAVDILLRSQYKDGRWGYEPKPKGHGDTSVTVCAVQALVSAKEAGIFVPDEVLEKAIKFTHKVQDPIEGHFGYTRRNDDESTYRTGAGNLILMLSGDRNSPQLQRGLHALRDTPDKEFSKTRHYFMTHFYCVQACYQAGDKDIQHWYPKIAQHLVGKQKQDGSWGGSDGGKIHPSFNTSVAILILGVPYRFLPIYQR
ncbi:MAG: terpene cyclase/mutase family protein [Planctomycetota bacterium]|jgi:squalene cyclase|nr:terpene cyclase/mutase family protein [Planctomycetota bacterium]